MDKTCVSYVRTRVLHYLDQYDEKDFEVEHFWHVQDHICRLAQIRGLNTQVAMLIGILHDSGRIVSGVSGKKHAQAGADYARRVMMDLPMASSTKALIIKAITNHSTKGRVDGPYDELIKDADVLAHCEEFPYEDLSWKEQVRRELVYRKELKITLKESHVGRIIDEKIKDLMDLLSSDQVLWKKGIVHAIRIQIRQLRSLIWYVKAFDHDQYKGLRTLNKDLKSIFNYFEDMRAYQVYKKICTSNQLESGQVYFQERIEGERLKLNDNLKKSLVESINQYVKTVHSIKVIENPVGIMDYYRSVLENTSLKNRKSLHDLRIAGKKLKSLHETGLIRLPEALYDLIKLLHTRLGEIHDLEELCLVIKSLNHHEKSPLGDLNKMIYRLEKLRDEENRNLKPDLLALRLLMQKKSDLII